MTDTNFADVFYPAENATTDTDTTDSGTTVEAEAVEVEQSTNDGADNVDAGDNPPVDTDSADVENVATDDEGQEVDDEPLYVEIDGKEISVKDFQNGVDDGLRQSDYTQKTQALAEDRKGFESERVKVNELSETLTDQIKALEHTFKKEEAETDWEHLRDTDPSEYLRLKEEQANKTDSLEAAKAEVKKLEDDNNLAFITQEQQKLVDAFPSWKDPATGNDAREKDSKLIEAYVADNGFSNDEFKNLTSSNVMIAIHKAAQFDALKKNGEAAEKIVRKAPRAIKPGPKKQQTKSKSAADIFYGAKKG